MAENEGNRKINYTYLNKRVTIFGDIPAIVLVFVLASLFLLLQGMIFTMIIVCGGSSWLIIHAHKKGQTTIRYIKDVIAHYLTSQHRTILPEISGYVSKNKKDNKK